MEQLSNIAIGIAGGTGYGAFELLRLLSGHCYGQVVTVSSQSAAGSPVTSKHPSLDGFYDLMFDAELDFDQLLEAERSVIFAALPHGASFELVSKIQERDPDGRIRVIDLSGDFRLKGRAAHETAYPDTPWAEELRQEFVFGLTEARRDQISSARFVANPGCYPTACSLATFPLIKAGHSGAINFDAKSGTSGAGRQAKEFTSHSRVNANFQAYNPLQHRHQPEIAETLGVEQLSFVPHLLPVARGILVSAYTTLSKPMTTEELLDEYREFYKDEPFVRVKDEPVDLAGVVGSNFCDISVATRGSQVVAMAAIDNLVKGMAGQAVQNMNVMFGLSERAGLWHPGIGLV